MTNSRPVSFCRVCVFFDTHHMLSPARLVPASLNETTLSGRVPCGVKPLEVGVGGEVLGSVSLISLAIGHR